MDASFATPDTLANACVGTLVTNACGKNYGIENVVLAPGAHSFWGAIGFTSNDILEVLAENMKSLTLVKNIEGTKSAIASLSFCQLMGVVCPVPKDKEKAPAPHGDEWWILECGALGAAAFAAANNSNITSTLTSTQKEVLAIFTEKRDNGLDVSAITSLACVAQTSAVKELYLVIQVSPLRTLYVPQSCRDAWGVQLAAYVERLGQLGVHDDFPSLLRAAAKPAA